MASDRQRSQRLPTIAKITIAGIESESISAIGAIVNDRQRSQKVNGNHQCSDCSDRNDRNDPSDHMDGNHSTAIATIVTITAIVCVLRSERSQRLYGNQTSAIVTITAIECFQRSSTIIWKLGFSFLSLSTSEINVCNGQYQIPLKAGASSLRNFLPCSFADLTLL